MIVKLLTEHHLEFLSFKGGCRGSSKSKLVKMPHCWKSHALAQMMLFFIYSNKKETSDFHGTVSFDPVKMLQQKKTNKNVYQTSDAQKIVII